MNVFLLRLLAVLLLLGGMDVAAFDPCPVCGGNVTTSEKVRDDRSKPSRNLEIWNRSMCATGPFYGSLVCIRCWLLSDFYKQEWERTSEIPDSFIPPLSKPIHDFPVAANEATYSRTFDGANLTDSLELEWDETKYPRYRDYCKQHALVMELQGPTAHDILKRIVIPDIGQPRPLEMGFTGGLSLIVKTKPKILYEKPLPSKRPVELRAAKAEYARSAESLRVRYINELLQMRAKAWGKSDDLAAGAVERELMTLALPKESDSKELTKMLIGKWKADGKAENRWGPIVRREGVWNQGFKADDAESAPWHVHGNQLEYSFPKREDGSQTTRRFTIILLNTMHLVCVEETESDGEIRRDVESWERIAEKKRR